MAYDVFVSYSSKDKPTADAVCAVLESHGIRCWVAPRDILPGRDWGGSIIEAIKGARVMVLVFSANANTSTQIKREVERAVNKGIPVIPLRIEDVTPTETLEYFLSTPHWLDAFTPPLEQHLEYLVDVVQKIIGQPSAVAGKKRELSTTTVAPPAEQASVRPPESKDLPEPSGSTKPAETKEHKELDHLKKPESRTRKHWMLVGAIVLPLLGVAGFLMWSGHQKTVKQAPEQKKDVEFKQKAADQGDVSAMLSLGIDYQNGKGVPQDFGKAAELFQKAADQGDARAQYNLGHLYYIGQGVPPDFGKAAELYQKAADQGYAEAQVGLGQCYEWGWGVPGDMRKAEQLYQKAAEQGNQDAIAKLKWLSELKNRSEAGEPRSRELPNHVKP